MPRPFWAHLLFTLYDCNYNSYFFFTKKINVIHIWGQILILYSPFFVLSFNQWFPFHTTYNSPNQLIRIHIQKNTPCYSWNCYMILLFLCLWDCRYYVCCFYLYCSLVSVSYFNFLLLCFSINKFIFMFQSTKMASWFSVLQCAYPFNFFLTLHSLRIFRSAILVFLKNNFPEFRFHKLCQNGTAIFFFLLFKKMPSWHI